MLEKRMVSVVREQLNGMPEGLARNGALVRTVAADLVMHLDHGNGLTFFRHPHRGTFARRPGADHYYIVLLHVTRIRYPNPTCCEHYAGFRRCPAVLPNRNTECADLVYSWGLSDDRPNGTTTWEENVDLIELLRRYLVPDAANDRIPDNRHPHRRRYTASYRRKRGICKNIWIGSGLLMCLHATPETITALGLGTTFLSFMILDETG